MINKILILIKKKERMKKNRKMQRKKSLSLIKSLKMNSMMNMVNSIRNNIDYLFSSHSINIPI